MEIKRADKPAYAYGYVSATILFKNVSPNSSLSRVNDYQRREQAVMRMFDRSMEISS